MSINAELIKRGRCNCAALRKASRRLSQLYDSALAPSGLKSTQFAIFAELEFRRGEPPTMRDLAKALFHWLPSHRCRLKARGMQRSALPAVPMSCVSASSSSKTRTTMLSAS